MGIEFMVMPLSRHLTGDYITPTMEAGWLLAETFVRYWPGGSRELPRGVPLGGPEAPREREAIQERLHEFLLPLASDVGAQLWDERSMLPPRIHKVDAASFGVLCDHRPRKPSWFAKLTRRTASLAPYAEATLFLPWHFDSVFFLNEPFERPTASVQHALAVLSSTVFPEEALPARETMMKALLDAQEMNLPMIVDS